MTIAGHISDLLYRYECVILPGFGAFLTQKESAGYDKELQAFYPPSRRIAFNAQLTRNDGLLANYMTETEGISYPSAITRINDYVYQLNLRLDNQEQVKMENIGSFSLSSEDSLQFEPLAGANFLTEAFGLGSVEAFGVKRENYKKQAEKLEEKIPVLFTPERRQSRPYLRYAAVGIIAIGLAGFAGLNLYSNMVSEHNVAEQQAAENRLQQEIQQATFVIDSPLPEITFRVTKQSGDYHIVAGAFRVEENAHQKVDELRENGYKARYIGANRYGLHQVVYSSYQTRAEALQNLREIKKSNDGAWLLIQEL